MNNTLTAKEWLDKETFIDGIITSKNKEKLMLSDLVEKYANYKNRILEDRIKEFRVLFKDTNMLKRIDKHFNIQNNIKE